MNNKKLKTVPIYQLRVARELLRLNCRIHDINNNKNGSGNLVFFFYYEDGLKETLKDQFNIHIR